MSYLLVLVALLGLMWLLLIRPQRRRQVVQDELLAGIEVGDEIISAGGMYGTIRALEEEQVKVEIAPGVEVKLDRRAIAAVVKPETEEPLEHEEEVEETEQLPTGER